MKAVLMAFNPEECEKIFSGKKTVDIRKVAPKLKTPYKVYAYMTATKERCRHWEYITAYQNSNGDIVNGSQKVVGEFVCDEKHDIQFTGASYLINNDISLTNDIARQSCLQFDDMFSYLGVKGGASLHITKPKRYDMPKGLWEFYKHDNAYDNMFGWVFEDREKKVPIKRPPQSYMYVEEIEE